MDSAKLIFTEAISEATPLKDVGWALAHQIKPGGASPTLQIDAASEERKKQAAKDFEGVLLHKLLDQMKNTIGDWGLEKDGLSKQVHGIFWLYLARDIANNGGFGMWKDIYKSLNPPRREKANATVESSG